MITNSKLISLSPIQMQFWVLDRINPGGHAYNIPLIYEIGGNINLRFLEKAFHLLADRHDILRTQIQLVDNSPYLKIFGKFPSAQVVLSEDQSDLTNEDLLNQIIEKIHKPFDLTQGFLWRANYWHGSGKSYLSIVFHHIITDLRTKEILMHDLGDIYTSLSENREVVLQADHGNYADVVSWYEEWQRSDEADACRKKWREELSTPTDQLDRLGAFSIGTKPPQEGNRYHQRLSTELSVGIEAYCQEIKVTPFVFLLSAYALLLRLLSGKNQFRIGVPFTNRRKEQFNETAGCFVNILPVTFNLTDPVSSKDLIGKVRIQLLKTHRIQETPFLELTDIGGDRHSGLFNTGFTSEPPVGLSLTDAEVDPVNFPKKGAQMTLFLSFWKQNEIFEAFWEYDKRYLNAEAVKNFSDLFVTLCTRMIEAPDAEVGNLNLISENSRNLIQQFNDTRVPYANFECLHHRFEKQADKTPDSPALCFDDLSYSYLEVEKKSNIIANALIRRGINSEDPVAIFSERNAEMVIAILGILKAGGAYLPLPVEGPPDRLHAILSDARPRYILCSPELHEKIPEEFPKIEISGLFTRNEFPDSRPANRTSSDNLAYIIYTSGSTGKPKGTLIEHHSVINRLGWMQNQFAFGKDDILLQKTPITFDVSVWELFLWFFHGGQLVLLSPGAEKLPETIADVISRNGVTRIHFVPSMFRQFLLSAEANGFFGKFSRLKHIFLSGEALEKQVVEKFNSYRSEFRLPTLVNLYGPTEATVDVSWYLCPEDNPLEKPVFIGKPIDNTGLYIVNEEMQIRPPGVPGELIITGVNLSRGYLNRDDLTAKVFKSFKDTDGNEQRAYCTGDLASLHPDGQIEYHGRIDNQVKIRGMRVELGEIEASLALHPEVQEAAAQVFGEYENKKIVGFIVTNADPGEIKTEIMVLLRKNLPDHMLPVDLVFLDHLPVNPNGKLDRKSLVLPEKLPGGQKKDEIPTGTLEKEIYDIFTGILNTGQIGISENFFEIGGNSLLAINLAYQLSNRFDQKIAPVQILEYPSVRAVAELIGDDGVKNKDSTLYQHEQMEKMQRRKDPDRRKRRKSF